MGIYSFLRITLLVAILLSSVVTRLVAFPQQSSSESSPQTSAKPCARVDCQSEDKQGNDNPPVSNGADEPHGQTMTVKKVFVNLPGDQKAIWTSPLRLRPNDAIWLAPLAVVRLAAVEEPWMQMWSRGACGCARAWSRPAESAARSHAAHY